MKKRFIVILAVSLAINMLLIGLVLGYHFRPRMPEMKPPMENIPMTSLDKARCDVKKTLETEPFSVANLQSALQNLRSEQNSWQEKIHQKMIDEAASASPSERHRLLKKYARPQHKQFAPHLCDHK